MENVGRAYMMASTLLVKSICKLVTLNSLVLFGKAKSKYSMVSYFKCILKMYLVPNLIAGIILCNNLDQCALYYLATYVRRR